MISERAAHRHRQEHLPARHDETRHFGDQRLPFLEHDRRMERHTVGERARGQRGGIAGEDLVVGRHRGNERSFGARQLDGGRRRVEPDDRARRQTIGDELVGVSGPTTEVNDRGCARRQEHLERRFAEERKVARHHERLEHRRVGRPEALPGHGSSSVPIASSIRRASLASSPMVTEVGWSWPSCSSSSSSTRR